MASLLQYLEEVLEEHAVLLEDGFTSLIEEVWLLKMIHKLRESYKRNGLI